MCKYFKDILSKTACSEGLIRLKSENRQVNEMRKCAKFDKNFITACFSIESPSGYKPEKI